MYVIAVVGLKGGSAKSTISAHLAVAAHLAGYATAIVDTDPQATLRQWGVRRKGEYPPVVPETTPDFLAATLSKFRSNGAEIVIVDTAGKAEAMGREAAKHADLVLVPTRTSIPDMDALPTSREMLAALGKAHFVVFADVDVTGGEGDVADATQVLDRLGMPSAHAAGAPVVHHRKAYKTAMITGQTVQETDPRSKAAEEAQALFLWAAAQLGLRTTKVEEAA